MKTTVDTEGRAVQRHTARVLGAGLRYSGTPGLLLASRPWGHLDRYIPASYGFF